MQLVGLLVVPFFKMAAAAVLSQYIKKGFDVPDVTPTVCRENNTDSFLIINVEVGKIID